MEGKGGIAPGSIITKPGVGSSYGNGWRQLWKHFLELLLILIISWVLSIPSSVLGWTQSASQMAGNYAVAISAGLAVYWLFSFVYNLLVLLPVEYGVSYAFLRAARADKLEIKDMFAAFKNYWNAIAASLLVGVIVVVGLIFIIVPGIVFACKLAFTPYLVVDKKMGVIEAVKESWRLTGGGRSWKVFLIGLLGIPIIIAGLIALGVGVIISFMWINMAIASLYHAVSMEGEVKSTAMGTI